MFTSAQTHSLRDGSKITEFELGVIGLHHSFKAQCVKTVDRTGTWFHVSTEYAGHRFVTTGNSVSQCFYALVNGFSEYDCNRSFFYPGSFKTFHTVMENGKDVAVCLPQSCKGSYRQALTELGFAWR